MNTQLSERVTEIEQQQEEMEVLSTRTQENTEKVDDLENLVMETLKGVPANALDSLDIESENIRIIRKITIKQGQYAYLHPRPDMRTPVIGHTLSGTQYLVIEASKNGWYKIQVENGTVGWIYGSKTTLEEIRFDVKNVTPGEEPASGGQAGEEPAAGE